MKYVAVLHCFFILEKKMKTVLVLSVMVAVIMAQRPPYAGKQPIGYPALPTTTEDALSNRFGEDTTTMRLPIEALGDVELVKRLMKLPTDQQPFWLINWLALEANRNNPQSYNPNPNSFLDNNRVNQG